MLKVKTGSFRKAEKSYILQQIFSDFLSVEHVLETDDSVAGFWEFTLDGYSVKCPSIFLEVPEQIWLKEDSLPVEPVKLPAVYAGAGTMFSDLPVWFYNEGEAGDQPDFVNVDIPGTIFFFLSRYEEMIGGREDQHGRFPYQDSILYKCGLIQRPVCNEYLELLKWLLKKQGFNLSFRNHGYRFRLSHDIDRPVSVDLPALRFTRKLAGDLLVRKSLSLMFRRLFAKMSFMVTGSAKADPNFNLRWIVDVCRRYNVRSCFYFIPRGGDTVYDSSYEVSEPRIMEEIRYIVSNHCQVGFHPSYKTMQNKALLKSELEFFRKALTDNGINYQVTANRFHYLRFNVGNSLRYLEEAGITEDESMGYSGSNGFRAGICYPYKPYDFMERRAMKLLVTPLVVMDVNTPDFETSWSNLRSDVMLLSAACRKFGGIFTFLIHNDALVTTRQKKNFESLVLQLVAV